MNTIDLLREAVETKGITVDEATFAVIDNTLCSACCDSSNGGNGSCKPQLEG
jgi:hypothetical protein